MKKAIIIWLAALVILCGAYLGIYYLYEETPPQPVITEPKPPEVIPDNKKSVKITAVGDCTFGSDINTTGGGTFEAELINNNYDWSYFFKRVQPIFSCDDITIINLEGVLASGGTREDKEYAFIGPVSYGNIFTYSSIEAANLANNHSMDYGADAYKETAATVENYGVAPFGNNKYVIKEINGIKVALIGTNALNYARRMAFRDVLDTVKQENPDLIIASFHWGEENEIQPTEIQTELAHYAIDNGVDLVIGHHPHIIQAVESYKGKYILYSLGNFCFGGNRNPVDKDTMIFTIEFIFEDGVLLKDNAAIIPCSVSSLKGRNNFQPTPLFGDEFIRVKEKIIERSGTENINFIEI